MKIKTIEPIAYIYTGFSQKFGIPRQSGLVPSLTARIVFEDKYKSPDAIKGLESFSHIWLLWGFSEAEYSGKLTVFPPRLGGRIKKGVFATRSPYRPNGIGMSSVKLERIEISEGNTELIVSGADILDGTPIYDIKPYIAYTDCHADAQGGYSEPDDLIDIDFPRHLLNKIPEILRNSVTDVLAQDPRAAFNKKEDFVYGLRFDKYDIRFTVKENKLTVTDVVSCSTENVK